MVRREGGGIGEGYKTDGTEQYMDELLQRLQQLYNQLAQTKSGGGGPKPK